MKTVPATVTSARAKRRPASAELATRLVQEWFDSLLLSADAYSDSGGQGDNEVPLGDAFEEVQQACRRAYVAAHGEESPRDEGEGVLDEMMAREAGYLIGVQVGLRLRKGGA